MDEISRETGIARLRGRILRLPGRYRHVLVRRYGLDGTKPLTLQRLSTELGILRVRVRQVQLEAEHVLGTDEQADLFRDIVA